VHKPYIINDQDGKPYAFNPGSPECVNFGEEKYDKGYYLVTVQDGNYQHQFRPTSPRPMLVTTIDLDGAEDADQALERFREQLTVKVTAISDERKPLLELKLTGRIRFHPFELGRERLRLVIGEICNPLHVEIKNHLSLVTREAGADGEKKNLAEIEKDVLRELITARSEYKGREDELVKLALAIRDQVLKGDVEGEELLGLLRES
jgi:DNA repair exonuclease SbcCD nuclease subunit